MIRALVFDCFGVFYVDPVMAYMHDPHAPAPTAKALHELDEAAAAGHLTKRDFDNRAATLLHETPREIERQFFHGKERNQQLLDFAQSLRATYKIALLSNIGSDMMDGFFTLEERRKFFDVVILSGEVGLTKPDPAIFALACERLEVSPAQAIMVDDIDSNVAGAKEAGMQGICYKDFTQFRTELAAIIQAE